MNVTAQKTLLYVMAEGDKGNQIFVDCLSHLLFQLS